MKFLFAILFIFQTAYAADEKGLLPEIKIKSGNETENQKKALQSELLISKSEKIAINSLIKVIQKNKGKPSEADLLFRLAELYARRSKSERFFELVKNDIGPDVLSVIPVEDKESQSNLKMAIKIYKKIESDFPKFDQIDSVVFNEAFANQQIGQKEESEKLYLKLVNNYKKSDSAPDAYLALGEIQYERQKFKEALAYYINIDNYPKSRVYPYALYKEAWSIYNMRDSDAAIDKMKKVASFYGIETTNPDEKDKKSKKLGYNLRAEALRDLAIFFSDTQTPEVVYDFFQPVTTPKELGDSLLTVSKIYFSHSKYNDLQIVANEFLKHDPTSELKFEFYNLLIDSYEISKKRDLSLKLMETAIIECRKILAVDTTKIKDSKKPEDISQMAHVNTCQHSFKDEVRTVSKKWWDLWNKNKQNKNALTEELASNTMKAFAILIELDPSDLNDHYAHAELLFQREQYVDANKEYTLVSVKSKDEKVKHDAFYSSIVCLEKLKEKTPSKDLDDKIQKLSAEYLKRFPTGEYHEQLIFKIAFTSYEEKNYKDAKPRLYELMKTASSPEMKAKCEDLLLDILNAEKNYPELKKLADSLSKDAPSDDRKKSLKKISLESDFLNIQSTGTVNADKIKNADEYYKFYNANKDQDLGQKAFWQAISLYFANGKPDRASELSLEYATAYPKDPKIEAALQDSVKYYSQNNKKEKAADVLVVLSGMNKNDEVKFLDAAGTLYTEIHADAKAKETYKNLNAKVIAGKIEPYYTKIQVKKVQDMLDDKDYSGAFNTAKGIINGSGPKEQRAMAKVVQAEVLEHELIAQSTTTTAEKLSLVLGIKTEKLDKAQTAYLSASRMSDDFAVQEKVAAGLKRCYENYIASVKNLKLKDATPDPALAGELAKLVAPIEEKLNDIINTRKPASTSQGGGK